MNAHEKAALEIRVNDIVRRVLNSQQCEDSLVELKAVWPTPMDYARRLAGQANAARSRPFLLLVGIDESGRTITGAVNEELSSWYSQVISRFDDNFAPRVIENLSVPFELKSVVAVLFETDRAPYVVKGSPAEREVPWREANRTRSAGCAELLSVLQLRISPPDVHVVSASLRSHESGSDTLSWTLEAFAYVVRHDDSELSIPFYQCDGEIVILNTEGERVKIPFREVTIFPERTRLKTSQLLTSRTTSYDGHSTLVADGNHIVFRGPGAVLVQARTEAARFGTPDSTELEVDLHLPIPQIADGVIHLHIEMSRDHRRSDPTYPSARFWTSKAAHIVI